MVYTKKSLGQHFLRSDRALSDIIGATTLDRDSIVLEIGPGEGVLTERLLKTGAKVIAVEKDDRLVPILSERFKEEIRSKRLILLHGDILKKDIQMRLEDILTDGWVLVANIPYYITGLILRTFLDGALRPEEMVLLVQREVGEDIVARDGKESIGSIAVKTYGTPRIVARVPRGAFVPPPSVDSVILHITDIRDPFEDENGRRRFFNILRAGFKSRRKTILNTLTQGTDHTKEDVGRILENRNIAPDTRPERLSVSDWRNLADDLTITLPSE